MNLSRELPDYANMESVKCYVSDFSELAPQSACQSFDDPAVIAAYALAGIAAITLTILITVIVASVVAYRCDKLAKAKRETERRRATLHRIAGFHLNRH